MVFGIICIRIVILICVCIKRKLITLELLEYSWMYILMSIGLWAQEAILLMCVSCDTRRIDIPLVDGLYQWESKVMKWNIYTSCIT